MVTLQKIKKNYLRYKMRKIDKEIKALRKEMYTVRINNSDEALTCDECYQEKICEQLKVLEDKRNKNLEAIRNIRTK